MGKRIKDTTILEQTQFEPKIRVLVDKLDSDAGIYPWFQAKNMQLKHLGNTYFQGSTNNSTWHDKVVSSDAYIRFSSDAGLNWRELSTKNVREDVNLYFTEERVLNIPEVANAVADTHVHANWNVLQNLTNTGDGLSYLNNAGEYTSFIVAGSGDVYGPSSAVDNNVALFHGTTGKLIKSGGALGTAAFNNSEDFATAAQGTLATNAVPNTRTVNGKALSSNITLTSTDVGSPSGSGTSSGTNTGDQDLSALQSKTIDVTVTTARTTATKVGTTSGGSYTPTTGDVINVNFTLGCAVSTPTLDIDGSGAKNIQLAGTNVTTTTLSTPASSQIIPMYYNGTAWQTYGSSLNTDTNTTYIESTTGAAVTATTQAVAINRLYYANNATNVDFTLPATCAINSVVEIVGMHATGTWSVITPSGDNIIIDGNDTGSAGTLTGAVRSTVKLRCTVANTTWEVTDYTGVIVTNTSYSTAKLPYVTPGTSGNVLTSNGTDWVSSIPQLGVDQTPQSLTYSATPVSNWETAANRIIVLTGNITNLTLQNVPNGGNGIIEVRQNGTGGYGIAAISHAGLTIVYQTGQIPTAANINSGANETTLIGYYRSGDNLQISFPTKETSEITLPPQTVVYSSTPTVDTEDGNDIIMTITGNVIDFVLTNIVDGVQGYINIIQGGSGSYQVSKVSHVGLTTRYVNNKPPILANMNSAVGTHTALFYKRLGSTLMVRVEPITAQPEGSILDNLIHKWDQTDVGTTMADSIGAIDGTDQGTVTHGSGADAGYRIYNGTNAGTQLNSTPSIFDVGFTNDFTISIDFEINTIAGNSPIFQCTINSTNNLYLLLDSGSKLMAQINIGGTEYGLQNTTSIVADTKHRAVMTWEKSTSTWKFYLDGVAVTTTDTPVAAGHASAGVTLAYTTIATMFSHCKIGKIQILDVVVASGDIGDL